MVVCGPASKVGPRPFRPQVISIQQLSQIDWGFHSAPISTALFTLTLLLNTLAQVSGVPRWTPIYMPDVAAASGPLADWQISGAHSRKLTLDNPSLLGIYRAPASIQFVHLADSDFGKELRRGHRCPRGRDVGHEQDDRKVLHGARTAYVE